MCAVIIGIVLLFFILAGLGFFYRIALFALAAIAALCLVLLLWYLVRSTEERIRHMLALGLGSLSLLAASLSFFAGQYSHYLLYIIFAFAFSIVAFMLGRNEEHRSIGYIGAVLGVVGCSVIVISLFVRFF